MATEAGSGAGGGEDVARMWIAAATLSHPGSGETDRLEALLALLSALDRNPEPAVLADLAPLVTAVAREAAVDDPVPMARLTIEWLERAGNLEQLATLCCDASAAPGLRRRAAHALLRAGGAAAAERVEAAAAADPLLRTLVESALASARLAPPQPPAGGPYLFPRACPACSGDLLHAGGIDLPSESADVRRISLWTCRSCRQVVEADSDRPPRFLFEQLTAVGFDLLHGLLAACPRPRDTACPCEAHRHLGRRAGG